MCLAQNAITLFKTTRSVPFSSSIAYFLLNKIFILDLKINKKDDLQLVNSKLGFQAKASGNISIPQKIKRKCSSKDSTGDKFESNCLTKNFSKI